METIGRIRREHFVRGKSIKEIVRALKVSRNTVRKVLRSGATSFEYMRVVQPRPKLGSWHADLDGMLSANEGKPARERLTLIRMFEELRGLGYEGSYDAVRRYAKRWLSCRRKRGPRPCLRLSSVNIRSKQKICMLVMPLLRCPSIWTSN